MGGRGSGSWHRWSARDLCDEHKRIDIRWMKREGMLVPDSAGTLSWNSGGEPSGTIRYEVRTFGVLLIYHYGHMGEECSEVREFVAIEHTPCHLGGRRPWFRCPIIGCGKRVAILYGAGRYFACRTCCDLAYETQSEDFAGRQRIKAQKLRTKLGGSVNMLEDFPEKPKGMWWRTYDRMRAEGTGAERLAWTCLDIRMGYLSR